MLNFDEITHTLSADVASGGSFTVAYPAGRAAADYAGHHGHQLISRSVRTLFADSGDFTPEFGASGITITINTRDAFAQGETVTLRVASPVPDGVRVADGNRMTLLSSVVMDFGAPIAADADSIATAQAVNAAGSLTLDGTLSANGVATLDVARNVTITSAGNDSGVTFTVTGTDHYGVPLVEEISGANAGTAAGAKAFLAITDVTADAAAAANVNVGHGDVLGLPAFLPDTAAVTSEIEDGSAATPGTLVAGDTATATATTGDVRGTYAPNSACDGTKTFEIVANLRAPGFRGVYQFPG